LAKEFFNYGLSVKISLPLSSARNKAFQESCEIYKNHIENEYELRSKQPS